MRIIDEKGGSLGVMKTSEALNLAHEKELDLVEVDPKQNPPICRLLNFGQLRYKQNKKNKVKIKKTTLKSIRISFKIGENDREFKRKQAAKFLSQGHKVKIEMTLHGREKKFIQRGYLLIHDFARQLSECSQIEQNAKKLGSKIFLILKPTTT